MYVQYLVNTYKAMSTVKNYLSGVWYWINHHKGDDSAFSSLYVSSVIKYNINKSNHVTIRAPLLSLQHLRTICMFFNANNTILPVFKAALLLGYFCFLRSSNLLSPTVTQWGGPHTLNVSDVIMVPHGIIVTIRSSKTIKNGRAAMLNVYAIPNNPCCPVAAWSHYIRSSRPVINGPAFMINPVTPLTPRPLVALIRLALQAAGDPMCETFTLHSIRRGAAQAAQKAGADRHSLKAHGTWVTDSALNTYLSQ